MQAILTKFLGPTNSRGARVKAWCQAGSITIPWDDALDINPNHDRAAKALRAKLGWDQDCYGNMVSGTLPDGSRCYVFTCGDREIVR